MISAAAAAVLYRFRVTYTNGSPTYFARLLQTSQVRHACRLPPPTRNTCNDDNNDDYDLIIVRPLEISRTIIGIPSFPFCGGKHKPGIFFFFFCYPLSARKHVTIIPRARRYRLEQMASRTSLYVRARGNRFARGGLFAPVARKSRPAAAAAAGRLPRPLFIIYETLTGRRRARRAAISCFCAADLRPVESCRARRPTRPVIADLRVPYPPTPPPVRSHPPPAGYRKRTRLCCPTTIPETVPAALAGKTDNIFIFFFQFFFFFRGSPQFFSAPPAVLSSNAIIFEKSINSANLVRSRQYNIYIYSPGSQHYLKQPIRVFILKLKILALARINTLILIFRPIVCLAFFFLSL